MYILITDYFGSFFFLQPLHLPTEACEWRTDESLPPSRLSWLFRLHLVAHHPETSGHQGRVEGRQKKQSIAILLHHNSFLVGGFNPFEKYSSKWESSRKFQKYLKPPPSHRGKGQGRVSCSSSTSPSFS